MLVPDDLKLLESRNISRDGGALGAVDTGHGDLTKAAIDFFYTRADVICFRLDTIGSGKQVDHGDLHCCGGWLRKPSLAKSGRILVPREFLNKIPFTSQCFHSIVAVSDRSSELSGLRTGQKFTAHSMPLCTLPCEDESQGNISRRFNKLQFGISKSCIELLDTAGHSTAAPWELGSSCVEGIRRTSRRTTKDPANGPNLGIVTCHGSSSMALNEQCVKRIKASS
ncbi:hypothetical protein HG530_001218 [Fusarium avenaceum]|nr:hypothetical protein HG530_001218 [Fusarium avenaceum]